MLGARPVRVSFAIDRSVPSERLSGGHLMSAFLCRVRAMMPIMSNIVADRQSDGWMSLLEERYVANGASFCLNLTQFSVRSSLRSSFKTFLAARVQRLSEVVSPLPFSPPIDLPQADPELTLKKPTPQSPLCGHPMTAARIPIRLCHVSGRTRTNRADTGLLR